MRSLVGPGSHRVVVCGEGEAEGLGLPWPPLAGSAPTNTVRGLRGLGRARWGLFPTSCGGFPCLNPTGQGRRAAGGPAYARIRWYDPCYEGVPEYGPQLTAASPRQRAAAMTRNLPLRTSGTPVSEASLSLPRCPWLPTKPRLNPHRWCQGLPPAGRQGRYREVGRREVHGPLGGPSWDRSTSPQHSSATR